MFTWFRRYRARACQVKLARLISEQSLPVTPRSWEPPVPPQAPMCRHHPQVPLLEEYARPGRYFCPLCHVKQRQTDPAQHVPGIRPFHRYRLSHVETEVLETYKMPEAE